MRGVSSTLLIAALAASVLPARAQQPQGARQQGRAYPVPPTGPAGDDYFGTRVPDPFRPLEDLGSMSTRGWVLAQNDLSRAFTHAQPGDSVEAWLTQLWPEGRTWAPVTAGDRSFFLADLGPTRAPAIMVQQRTELAPHVLIMPSRALGPWAPSPDGRVVAYSLDDANGWRFVAIRDARTGRDLPDTLRGVRDPSIAWTQDGRGFFYVTYDVTPGAAPLAPVGAASVRYHRVGQPQGEDYVVASAAAHPDWRYDVRVSDDGHYAVIGVRTGLDLRNRLWFVDLDDARKPRIDAPIVRLFDQADATFDFVASDGATFYVRTTRSAPRGQLVAVDINHPHEANWRWIVRESFDPMVAVLRVGDRFVVHSLHDVRSGLRLYALDGSPRGEVPLGGAGTVTELVPGTTSRDFFFTFESFLAPPSVYHYDLDAKTNLLYRETRVEADRAHLEVRQVFYPGRDGAELPLWIVSRRGVALDRSHPLWLSLGGTPDRPVTPRYSAEALAWVEGGGVFAVAALRGGTEYGQGWHDAGSGDRRTTSIDDATSAAEFLIREGYTSAEKLAIGGRGAGALTAATVAVQHPELAHAVIARDGMYDLVRFPRFGMGADWIPELGSPDNPRQFRMLFSTSPIASVREAAYPAFWIEAGMNDREVAPLHSLKLAATLQGAQRGSAPVLLRVRDVVLRDADAAANARIDAAAERLRFLLAVLGP